MTNYNLTTLKSIGICSRLSYQQDMGAPGLVENIDMNDTDV